MTRNERLFSDAFTMTNLPRVKAERMTDGFRVRAGFS